MARWTRNGFCSIRIAVIGVLLGASLTASAWARNPWASEVGDARAVQSKTEDIAERLREDFPFCPATSIASHLDQTANQLESLIEQGASWWQVQSALRQTRSLATQTHRIAASDRHVREDKRLMSYFGELYRRLDKLDQELREANDKNSSPICLPERPHGFPGGNPHGGPIGYPGGFPGRNHEDGYYPNRPSQYPSWDRPNWNTPSWDTPAWNTPSWERPSTGRRLEIQIQSNREPARRLGFEF